MKRLGINDERTMVNPKKFVKSNQTPMDFLPKKNNKTIINLIQEDYDFLMEVLSRFEYENLIEDQRCKKLIETIKYEKICN